MSAKTRPELLHKLAVRMLVPAGAGFAGSLALPPWHIWPLLPVAFSLLAWMLDFIAVSEATPARRYRAAALAGWSFGFGWFVFSCPGSPRPSGWRPPCFAWLIPFVLMLLPAGLALFWAAATAIAMRLVGIGCTQSSDPRRHLVRCRVAARSSVHRLSLEPARLCQLIPAMRWRKRPRSSASMV